MVSFLFIFFFMIPWIIRKDPSSDVQITPGFILKGTFTDEPLLQQ